MEDTEDAVESAGYGNVQPFFNARGGRVATLDPAPANEVGAVGGVRLPDPKALHHQPEELYQIAPTRAKSAARNLACLRIYRRSTIFASLIDSGNLSIPLMSFEFFEKFVKSSSSNSHVLKLSNIRLIAPNQTTIHHPGMLESFPFLLRIVPKFLSRLPGCRGADLPPQSPSIWALNSLVNILYN